MSGKGGKEGKDGGGGKNPKGVVNTFRRTWDKEEFREKAEEREEKVGAGGVGAVLVNCCWLAVVGWVLC